MGYGDLRWAGVLAHVGGQFDWLGSVACSARTSNCSVLGTQVSAPSGAPIRPIDIFPLTAPVTWLAQGRSCFVGPALGLRPALAGKRWHGVGCLKDREVADDSRNPYQAWSARPPPASELRRRAVADRKPFQGLDEADDSRLIDQNGCHLAPSWFSIIA